MEYFDFRGKKLARVFKGNWQLAGGHGEVDIHKAIDDLFLFVEHGINVFDVGDIYTGAEEIIGAFLKRYKSIHGTAKFESLRVHTKFVPDLNALEDLTKKDIRFIIERSLQRLGLETLHLVQFHWWDYSKGDMLKAALYLEELRETGLIDDIGVTNMDTEHLKMLLDSGVKIASNQIQFSLLDPRALNGMLDLAKERNIAIFAYGVLAGGLLGNSNPIFDPTNRSHIKYKLIIDEITHDYYDELLTTLTLMADEYATTVSDIATKFVLQTEGVSSAILGPRNQKHIKELDNLWQFQLSDDDYQKLLKPLRNCTKKIKDDIYSYERVREGPHGKIMKYNLNNMRISKEQV
jgi:aryl-alcohol dehydrogenase-like predicted oxidoreductase